jgi:transcriptional regulator with XRE-family HTH domain
LGIINCSASGMGLPDARKVPTGKRPLHRLGMVRRLQGISRRTMARRLNTEVAAVRLQERETADLLLSKLYEWQQVLDVPVAELLVEAGDPLSTPVLQRALLVRVMKTAQAILGQAKQVRVRRMAQTLVDQLIEIMPELAEVGPWHAVGKRRRRDEYGAVVQRRLSEDVFLDLKD